MKMGIGAKMAFGFGALIVIAGLLGGMAVWKMTQIGTEAKALDEEYIEEAKVAMAIQDNLNDAMIQMRTFGLTESQECYDSAMKSFKVVQDDIGVAQTLAKSSAHLSKLDGQSKEALSCLQDYMGLCDKTLGFVKRMQSLRGELENCAAAFDLECGQFLENQISKYREDVIAAVPQKELERRLDRILATHDLLAAGKTCVQAVVKAEAQKRPELAEEAIKGFGKINESIAALLQNTVQAKNKEQLSKCRDAADGYKKSLQELQRIWKEMESLQKARYVSSNRLLDVCGLVAKEGIDFTKASSAKSAKALAQASLIMIVGLILALIVAVGVSTVITKGILKPINRTAEIAGSLASQSEELSTVSGNLLSASEEMNAQSGNVAAATEEMSANISAMASASEEMNVNAQSVASASEQMSRNVANVAGAIEELSASMKAVGDKAHGGEQIASEAMRSSKGASETMGQLGLAAQEIGQVTETIKRIAEQTNLLALNATIEAASAGDAGRGFAVVANEIKELANQSAQAAEDITKRIRGVQAKTDEAVKAISDVSSVILKLNEASAAISEMVTEQAKATNEMSSNVAEANTGVNSITSSIKEVAEGTREMSRNAGEAAKGANDVSSNIGEVKVASGNTSANASQVNSSATELSKLAGELNCIVAQIKGV